MQSTFFCFCDAASTWQFGMQDPATPTASGIFKFHNDLIFIFIFVVVFITWFLFRTLIKFNSHTPFIVSSPIVHGATLEVIWTLVPTVILIVIAVPSFSLLYAVDEYINPSMTLKVLGNQWYWSYEYSDYISDSYTNFSFDSYLLSEDDFDTFDIGLFRLLEVDNRVLLPENSHVRVIVTSSDVLHCWTIPSFGIKIDACPGRLNEASLFVERFGVYYGQCSEICGLNHGIIPIVVEVVSIAEYLSWVSIQL